LLPRLSHRISGGANPDEFASKQPARWRGLLLKAASFLLLCVAALPAVRAELLRGQVVAVSDGDTVTLIDGDQIRHKVRLAGIDAPEARQPYGQVARRSLSEMVEGRWVQVHYDKSDRYGRLVGKIELDGRDINLEQLRRGLAWHYKQYQNEQSASDRQIYAATEQQAQIAQRGLWRDVQPQAPWDYRAALRQSNAD
jgi:endonuclease YncB( thermonuclease family)